MKKMYSILLFLSFCFGCGRNDNNVEPALPEPTSTTHINTLAGSSSGGLTDTNIRYFGRWDLSDNTRYVSYWGGAYIKVRFTGTTVKIKVGMNTNYYAKIDNGPWVTYSGVSGTVDLTSAPLTAGTHTLSVAQGKDYSYVFDFQGLILDPGATTSAPAVGADLIEYIGDSITAGYTDPQANVSDYAWVCSESLGTEHTQIAYPGIALTDGYGLNSNKTGMSVQYFKLRSIAYTTSSNWDLTRYTPKLVVINLGQNDHGTQVPDNTFQTAYVNFLTNVRTNFPNAHIFVMRTFSGVKAAPTLAAVNARVIAGDDRLHFIDTNGWLNPNSSDYTTNDAVHPSASGHIKAAGLLAPILAPYLTGQTAPVPVTLDACDGLSGWASQNALTLNDTDKKEGTGALQSTGNGTLEFQKVMVPVNTNATVQSGALRFWYYVSDAGKFSANDQIELGSGGAPDTREFSWAIGPLHNGWNLITKTFASAAVTGGVPDLKAINWIRVYHAKTAGMVTRIDQLHVIR